MPAKAGIYSVTPNLGPRVRGHERSDSNSCRRETGECIMASYGPELIQTMRAVLDEVMTKIPVDQVTPGLKAHMAQVILKAAAEGQTSYDGLFFFLLVQRPPRSTLFPCTTLSR